mgnify:CR=1 FL=1
MTGLEIAIVGGIVGFVVVGIIIVLVLGVLVTSLMHLVAAVPPFYLRPRSVDEVQEQMPGAPSVERLVQRGLPSEALCAAAADADLIVVGTHGRSGPRRLLLGSGADQIIRLAPVPVLVTR